MCKNEEIHPKICSGIKTRTDKQTAEHQDDRTDVGLPPPQLRQAGDKKLSVRNNVLMRDVIGKMILNRTTHLFLSRSEQNKSSKVAVATIKKEATLPILSTNCSNTPHTSLPPPKKKTQGR